MKNTIALLCMILLPVFASAKTVYVVKAKGSVDSQTLESVTALVESVISDEGDFRVVDNRWKADVVLIPKVLKLGNSYILTVGKFKDKKLVTSKKMKSSTIEDMDTVVSRVVRAVLAGEDVSETARIDEVTKDEMTRSQTKYQAIQQWSFGIGPAVAGGMNYDGTGASLLAGYNFGLDPDFDLAISGELLFATGDTDVNFTNLVINLSYFLNRSKNAPFVRGGIGYGFASAAEDDSPSSLIGSDDNVSAFSGMIGAGFKFFRTSTVNMGLELTTSFLFDKTSESGNTPSLTSLRLVVSY